MYIVYVLKSSSKNFRYVGMTNNLERKLKEHVSGYSKTTKRFLPVEFIYKEEYKTRTEAREREKYLKSGIGRDFLNKL